MSEPLSGQAWYKRDKRLATIGLWISILSMPWVIWAAIGGPLPYIAMGFFFIPLLVSIHLAGKVGIAEIEEWKRNAPKCPSCGQILR